jgi:hypothetical protein
MSSVTGYMICAQPMTANALWDMTDCGVLPLRNASETGGTEDCGDSFGGGKLPPIEASSARFPGHSSSRTRGSPDPAPPESYSRCVDRPASGVTIALCAMMKAFEDLCPVGGLENNRYLRPIS